MGRAAAAAPAAWALGLTVGWLVLAALLWSSRGAPGVAALGVLAPIGLVWLWAGLAATLGAPGEDAARREAQIEALTVEVKALKRAARRASAPPPAEEAEPARPPEPRPRPAARPRPEPEPEPETRAPRAQAPPLQPEAFVRALDFPEHERDEAGFAAMRRALADPHARKLVQASQDVLTLLSQNGVYMDDLAVEPAPPSLWRRYAGGVRGSAVADLAGVADAEALELAGTRMARDTVFRDAAQHFLRQFDLGLQRFVTTATDDHVAALAQTRTARAFMLLARAAGTVG